MNYVYITDDDYARAAANGIKHKTLDRRIRNLGWPKERAITEPIMKRDGFTARAMANGISKSTYQGREAIWWEKAKCLLTFGSGW